MNTHEPFVAKRRVLTITGMTCSGCASSVTRVLSRVPGIVRAEVDFAGARAVVEGSAGPEALVAAVEAAGYGAEIADVNTGQGRKK